MVNKIFAYSPILFGDAYRGDLERAPNVTVLLHANLLGLEAAAAGDTVQEARIGTLDGRRGTIRARHYVLACGGIENARLLLLSDSVVPQGLGNRNDLVGRVASGGVSEVILAVNATVEGQTTAHYIMDQLAGLGVKVSRLAHGVPVGGELDYLDEGTLSAAIRQRTKF